MKIYSHISKFAAYRILGGRKGVEEMRWMATRKPGDLINGCTHWPFNSRVVSVELGKWKLGPTSGLGNHSQRSNRNYSRCKNHRINPAGVVVSEAYFIDNYGHHHSFPGGGCVERPLTVKQIHEIILSRYTSEKEARDLNTEAAKRWHGRDELTATELAKIENEVTIWKRVRDGLPVCDEFGIRFEEYRSRPV
jgi:hypothetical protein